MARIISLINQAGGVAKSTVALNLGFHLAADLGKKVLLVDTDPQGNLTDFMGLDSTALPLEQTIYPVFSEQAPLPIHRGIHMMDLVPANFELGAVELPLTRNPAWQLTLKQALAAVEAEYDYILIDSRPSLGLLNYTVLVAAQELIIPVATTHKALRGAEMMFLTLQKLKQTRLNPTLRILGFIPTIHDVSTRQARRSLAAIQEQLGSICRVFPEIRKRVALQDASEQGLPLALVDANQQAVQVFKAIAREIDGTV